MIVREQYEVNGNTFVRTYSSSGFLIYGGSPEGNYEEANDLAELNRTYTETDIPIGDDADDDADKAEAYDILMGESE